MITGNPLTEPPHTPFPDELASSDSETPPASQTSPPPNPGQSLVIPETTTADDISLILTTSIEKPEPDPMLGSASPLQPSLLGDDRDPLATFSLPPSKSTSDPLGVDIGINLVRSSDNLPPTRAPAEPSEDEIDDHVDDEPQPPYSLATLLLASYASAVTLALFWVLWTGRGFTNPGAQRSEPVSSVLPAIDWRRTSTPASASPLPADRMTSLGKPLVVGDLEVTPIVILHQDVHLYRIVDPEGERRENPDCLVLTLRLTNRSSDRTITPLELASLREAADPAGTSFIESPTGERIAMFKLAMESEWSIEGQAFPAIEPGRSEDVILVSEPVLERQLASPLIWRVKVKTGADPPVEIGVRFSLQEVGGSDR